MTSRDSDSLTDAYRQPSASDSSDSGFSLSFGQTLLLVVAVSLISSVLVAGLSMMATSGGGIILETGTEETTVLNVTTNSTGQAAPVVYNTTRPSVVSIYSIHNGSIGTSQGSGFVYEGGYIVTNNHVVSGASEYYIRYKDGEWTKATLVGTDAYTDLAVLDPNSRPEYATPLSLATDLPNHGDRVYAIGTPGGLQGSITTGIVSGVERSMTTKGGFAIPDMIQTDAPLNPGNSGGPLISTDGKVVGVNRARQGENIGFAISARMTKTIVESLIEDGSHDHPLVGVRSLPLTPQIAEANNISANHGVLITDVMADAPADGTLQAGTGNYTTMNGQKYPLGGDVIIAVDGEEVKNNEDLSSYLMRETAPGDEVTFTIIRSGEEMNVTVTLGERP